MTDSFIVVCTVWMMKSFYALYNILTLVRLMLKVPSVSNSFIFFYS